MSADFWEQFDKKSNSESEEELFPLFEDRFKPSHIRSYSERLESIQLDAEYLNELTIHLNKCLRKK